MAPGLAEAMRQAGSEKTPHAMWSRAAAGMRARTLIVNLPGSPQGAVESLQVLLPALQHGLHLLRDDPAAESGHPPASPRRCLSLTAALSDRCAIGRADGGTAWVRR